MATDGQKAIAKAEFAASLAKFVSGLSKRVCTEDGQWAIKGFIDLHKNVYSISSDTKVTSKILEIQIFPELLTFASEEDFDLILTEHQNYYPDMSFVSKKDSNIKFAVDLKTTYRLPRCPHQCNGFTLGSHGKYFTERTSLKNIRFPYGTYSGHFCLGLIYDRAESATIDETVKVPLHALSSIASVMSNLQFFVAEKWQIASDKQGSNNTANIGSIKLISDVVSGKGMFANLGEEWFDEYWINYAKIQVANDKGEFKAITTLKAFVEYRKGDASLILPRRTKD